MKTEDLVALLSTRVEPVDAAHGRRRFLLAAGVGSAIAVALVLRGLKLNPGLGQAILVPMFWVREAFCAALAGAGMMGLARLARPGRRLGIVPAAVVIPVVAMWLLAMAVLTAASPPDRLALIVGRTARVCPFLIALLAVPSFIAFIWLLRGLAPTRLRLAGAAAGFAAGSIGALAYSLHCPEFAAPFIAAWYLLGMAIPTVIGAWLGPRLLRW